MTQVPYQGFLNQVFLKEEYVIDVVLPGCQQKRLHLEEGVK